MNETKTQQKKEPSKGGKVLKAVFNTIINILIVLVLITSLLIAVMALTSKANGLSTVFGYTIQAIQSDSMKGGSPDGYEGGDFGKGDLIIGKATNADANAIYEQGDIVTYRVLDTNGDTVLLSHRIVNVYEDENGNSLYQTWGDNREVSSVPDQLNTNEYITAASIVAVNHSAEFNGTVITGLGNIIDYLRTQQGFFFAVLLPMIIFFMYELVRVVLNATNYKKAKSDEDKQAAVDEAVAAALAAKEAEKTGEQSAYVPAGMPGGMTAEQMEQFKQFMEFQKMQNAAKEATAEETSKDE